MVGSRKRALVGVCVLVVCAFVLTATAASLYDYTPEELSIWAQRIRDSGAHQSWIYFNNDRDGYAIKNAKQLLSLLGDPLVRLPE